MTAITERDLAAPPAAPHRVPLDRSSYSDQIFKNVLTLAAVSIPLLLCFLMLEL